jgi:hypothetical protein
MTTNQASAPRTALATVTSLALLAVLTGGACGGVEALAPSATSDASSGDERGAGREASAGQDASADEEVGGDREAGGGDVADTGAPDGPIRVPTYHRPEDSQCATPRPAGTCAVVGTEVTFTCASDGDCIDGGADGRCTSSGGGPAGCFCTYDACQTDADCATNELCVCHGSAYAHGGNQCLPGNCRVDSDCGAGGDCSPAHGTSNCGYVSGYYCHTQSDECTNDSDCGGDVCTWSVAGARWTCQAGQLCL